ncbi:MAG: MFS transporter [Gordonia sp. (in: high G+C Gram-positive bacteria)]|uniref:MFS transporter n=1 Tax=Gordonia sp. (in: high G+C Gram-positive bacteria) TaxID=84139 RepID=UPI003C78C87E
MKSDVKEPTTLVPMFLAAYVFAVVMMGTTLPTPLYPRFQLEYGFGAAITTILFAVYAAGVIAGLIIFGRMSDSVGRKPILLLGLVLSAVSAVAFLVGGALWILYLGRILSGLAAGVFTATGTVTVIGNAPRGRLGLASTVATAANMGGLGLGILMAGTIAPVVPDPLFDPFLIHLVLLVIAGFALYWVHETPPTRKGISLQLPGLPEESRAVFLAAVPGAVAGFSLAGVYSAVAPNLLTTDLGASSSAVIGIVLALFFLVSAAAQIVFRSLPDRTLMVVGLIGIVVSSLMLIGALLATNLPLFIAAIVVTGFGQGLAFMAGMRALTAVTPPEQRANVTTSYFVVGYLSISIPSIATGLIAHPLGLVTATVIAAAVFAALAFLGLPLTKRVRTA